MSEDVFAGQKVEFPVRVHYRVLCVADPDVNAAIVEAARCLGLGDQLKPGNPSSGGRYQSHQLSVMVENRERMDEIDAAFRAVPGVKMVL